MSFNSELKRFMFIVAFPVQCFYRLFTAIFSKQFSDHNLFFFHNVILAITQFLIGPPSRDQSVFMRGRGGGQVLVGDFTWDHMEKCVKLSVSFTPFIPSLLGFHLIMKMELFLRI